jgi:hypothetical protein
MANEFEGLDEFIAQTFSADFRSSLTGLLMQTAKTAAQQAADQVAVGMIQNFDTALAKFDIEVRVENVDDGQHIILAGRGIREVTTVTKHDSKGRIAEFIKTIERSQESAG